jgi:hypothetical protein
VKPASVRTTAEYHLRALWRTLLVARDDLLDWLEHWWRRNVIADDPFDRARNAEPLVLRWLPDAGTRYRDGQAEFFIPASAASDADRAGAYLASIGWTEPEEATWPRSDW